MERCRSRPERTVGALNLCPDAAHVASLPKLDRAECAPLWSLRTAARGSQVSKVKVRSGTLDRRSAHLGLMRVVLLAMQCMASAATG